MGGVTPDIPGVRMDDPAKRAGFQREINQLIGRPQDSFPGSQPVSFSRRHFQALRSEDYFVCEKTDGVRCLLWLTTDVQNGEEMELVYLIDRKNEFYWVELIHIPVPGNPEGFHNHTLLDGELVWDEDDGPDSVMIEGKRRRLYYYTFDCLVIDGKNLVGRSLESRLGYMGQVFPPYNALFKQYPEERETQIFMLKEKQVQRSYAFETMFKEIIPKLPHGNDGLIFTCVNSPYKPGTDDRLFKWKRAEENSVDFLMVFQNPEQDFDAIPRVMLYVGDVGLNCRYWDDLYVPQRDWDQMVGWSTREGKGLDHQIVECAKDLKKRWRFLRFREDKRDPNFIRTVQSVMSSIDDAVSEKDLLSQAPAIQTNWRARLAAKK